MRKFEFIQMVEDSNNNKYEMCTWNGRVYLLSKTKSFTNVLSSAKLNEDWENYLDLQQKLDFDSYNFKIIEQYINA